MKKSILITGGGGDIAVHLTNEFKSKFNILSPRSFELDVTNIESVSKFFNGNTFDIVINNAGTLYSSLVEDSDPNKWINDINVNLIGTYLISREAVLKNRDVRIINISSTAAMENYKDWTSYCASKAGVVKLSKGMAEGGFDVVTMCAGAGDTKIRNGLNIKNNNIMTLDEITKPIIDCVNGKYDSGDVIFYRKDYIEINPTGY